MDLTTLLLAVVTYLVLAICVLPRMIARRLATSNDARFGLTAVNDNFSCRREN